MKRTVLIALAVLLALVPVQAGAMLLTVDNILFEGEGVVPDPLGLAGSVDLEIAAVAGGYWAYFTLTNLTPADAFSGDSSSVLLSGLGFVLPDGVYIDYGSATVPAGSTVYDGSSATSITDVSQEWGYTNYGPAGAFNDLLGLVNTQITTMNSSTDTQFADGTIGPPPGLNGPSWGVLSSYLVPGAVGGYQIQDSLLVHAFLSSDGTFTGDLWSYIQSNEVQLTFGSPDRVAVIPEPGTFLLLGSGLLGVGIYARKRLRDRA